MPAKRICDVLVLRALAKNGAMTAANIAQVGGIARKVVNEGLRHLRFARRVHVSGFDDANCQGRERPIYAVGDLPNAVFIRKSNREYRARYATTHRLEIRIKDRARRNGWNKPLERRAS